MFSSKTSKLIPIACIVALVVGVLFLLYMGNEMYNLKLKIERSLMELEKKFGDDPAFESLKKEDLDAVNHETKLTYTIAVGLFIVLSVISLLAFLGRKKNSKKMVLTASILYLLSVLGIPSAVLCFIAYAKMKKQE